MNLVAQTVPNVAPVRPRTFVHLRELDGVRGLAALMVFLAIRPNGLMGKPWG